MQKLLFILLLLITYSSPAQDDPQLNDQGSEKGLIPSLLGGNFKGQLRYHFLATDNANINPDPFAHAAGAAATYTTKPFKNFYLNLGGAVVGKIKTSSVLTSESLLPNRYEISLVDLEHPDKKIMGRVEELNLTYENEGLKIITGRHLLVTPFLNPQDGRLRPTMYEGIWSEWKHSKWKVNAGWISGVAPRSIYNWKSVGNSIGLYPQGIQTDGQKSNYAGQLSSKGIALAALHFRFTDELNGHVWNQWVENIFNTLMAQMDYEKTLGNIKFYSSAQVIRQNALNNGGNADPSRTYFDKGSRSLSFGLRTGMKWAQNELSINYNRITAEGRYLMPREWGKDPFYTFMPRERNEGLGDAQALTVAFSSEVFKKIKTGLTAGYFDLPDVNNYKFNKYGLPSYFQVNAELKYALNPKMEAGMLYVYKGLATEDPSDRKYFINKIDMSLYHLMLSYNF